jgi:hypothetical protein
MVDIFKDPTYYIVNDMLASRLWYKIFELFEIRICDNTGSVFQHRLFPGTQGYVVIFGPRISIELRIFGARIRYIYDHCRCAGSHSNTTSNILSITSHDQNNSIGTRMVTIRHCKQCSNISTILVQVQSLRMTLNSGHR